MFSVEPVKPQPANQLIGRALAETETFGHEDLAAYQRNQLQQLLIFARAQSPFYRDRLASLFRRDGTIDWPRWRDLPVLTRADIRQHGEAMRSQSLPPGHGPAYEAASSGTTGTPVTIHSTRAMYLAGSAAFARACRWYGYNENDRTCVVFNASQTETLRQKNRLPGDASDSGQSSPDRLVVSWTWSAERILSLMEQHRSTCFSGYATTLENTAEAQLERRANIAIKFMVGTSMALTARARELTAQAFNARAFSAYTSKEAHKIAHECPVSGGFHVNSELVLVEILDDSGRPCGPGEVGRVIVTPFLSTAQPLIRYEQGDLAAWGGSCPCGRAHALIARIDGRVRNQFRFLNGHRFMPGIGHETFRDLLKADRWQVAQTGPLDIEVRYISPAPADTINFAAMTATFRQAYHRDLNVVYRKVDAMPLTPAGKFIDYVNEIE